MAGSPSGIERREAEDAPLRPGPFPRPRARLPVLIPVLLFLLTVLTTTLAFGPLYSAALLAILGAHEMGHWLMCRHHRVSASLPWFLPLPLGQGTMGAVIRIRSPFPSRRALFDIGAAGPLAGLLVAIPVTLLGLALSTVETRPEAPGTWWLGDSLAFLGLTRLTLGAPPPGHDVYLHPVALAGWFGLFVTGLNLLPIGQLDGGHVVYSLLGRQGARRVTVGALLGFAALTFLVYNYWCLFLVLVGVVARRHPEPLDDATPLDPGRVVLAVLTLLFFFLTFTPVPVGGIPSLWDLLFS